MSERTTIGGTVYESIGSSSSNLLLKCNGIARIQWGSKLIDLIKNGKIVSSSQELLFVVSNSEDIKSDGIYVVDTEEQTQLWICNKGNKYNLTGEDLYISTSKDQKLTAEQKNLVLGNIGIYHQTLTDLQNAELQNGIAYVIETNTLYTIKDGVISEFTAKLDSVTVETNEIQENVIKGSLKIILQVNDTPYIIMSDEIISVQKPIVIKDGCSLQSEFFTDNQGYKIYMKDNISYLDIDIINIRKKLLNPDNIPSGSIMLYNSQNDIPSGWYICNGGVANVNGVSFITPDLSNNHIKNSDGEIVAAYIIKL